MTHTCKSCEHFIRGRCLSASEVIDKHGKQSLDIWTEHPDVENKCSLFDSLTHQYDFKRWTSMNDWRSILSYRIGFQVGDRIRVTDIQNNGIYKVGVRIGMMGTIHCFYRDTPPSWIIDFDEPDRLNSNSIAIWESCMERI
jgi:hypothetical protein